MHIMKELEILGANRFETYTKIREGSRAVIVQDDKILLTHETISGWFLVPGGGIEENEEPEEYCYTSYYFICEVTGHGRMHLTDAEKRRGVTPAWIPLREAIDIFSKYNRNAMSVVAMASSDSYDEVDRQIHLITDTGDSRLMVKSKQDYLDEYGDFVGMMKLVGGMLASILALIGILNFINAVVTGIFSRKRELAMMNAVGMVGNQIKKMLMWEGVYYAVLIAICSTCFAVLLSNVVINSVVRESPFFSYNFTLEPIGICVPVLIIISVLIPLVSYQTICGESIVDRIREN